MEKGVAIVGTGYVGLVTGASFADLGHEVWGFDVDRKKIANLKKGIMPFFEPGLRQLVKKNVARKKLHFTSDIREMTAHTNTYFITVGTPSRSDGSVDMKYVKSAVRMLAPYMKSRDVIVSKSTVPIGTAVVIRRLISKTFTGDFSVVSNPEFLQEARAIESFVRPDRIILGYESNAPRWAVQRMSRVYQRIKAPVIETDNRSAELIKYAANVYLAGQISFINSIARLCEEIGADVDIISKALRADKRIGERAFLSAGIGYGGLCFPKDVRALIKISQRIGYHFDYLSVIEKVNKEQRTFFVNKIRSVAKKLKGKHVAILGLSFKPKTDDIRDAPSLDVIRMLIRGGARVRVHDPVAIPHVKKLFGDTIRYYTNPYSALRGADVMGIVTEWPEYRKLDLKKVKRIMKKPNIIDGRNIFDPRRMAALGITYRAMGRGYEVSLDVHNGSPII